MQLLNSQMFTWSRWRAGSPLTFFTVGRTGALIKKRWQLIDHTVGYCDASLISCRPKINNIAVMFHKDDALFWFHMKDYEFENIYKSVL